LTKENYPGEERVILIVEPNFSGFAVTLHISESKWGRKCNIFYQVRKKFGF
jgi:hypothetical protein